MSWKSDSRVCESSNILIISADCLFFMKLFSIMPYCSTESFFHVRRRRRPRRSLVTVILRMLFTNAEHVRPQSVMIEFTNTP